MKFKLTKASDYNFEDTIEFETLQDLLKFVSSVRGCSQIILGTMDDDDVFDYEIIIYDWYVE